MPVDTHSRHPRHLTWPDHLIIVLGLLAVFLPGTVGVSLFDRDEGWYAYITRAMVDSGDWIIPRYLGESRYFKPPLMYWCSATSALLMGWSEFALRLPCVLASVATWTIVAHAAARRSGRRAGYWTAVVGATSFGPNIAGKLMLADSYLLLFLSVAIVTWLDGIGGARRSTKAGCVFWIAIGLAVLAKGPAALAVLVPLGLVMLLTEPPSGTSIAGRLRCLWPGPRWYLAPLIALPWYLAAAATDWDAFKADFLAVHFLARLTQSMEGHAGFPGYYLLTGLILLWPWAGLVPSVLVTAWRDRRHDPMTRRLLIWLIAPWPLFELIQTKLPHYVLPLFPPLAILVGCELARVSATVREKMTFDAASRIAWLGGLMIGAAAVITTAVVLWGRTAAYGALGAGAILLVASLVAARPRRAPAWGRRCVSAAVGVALCYAVVGWIALPQAEPDRLSRRLAEAANERVREGEHVLASGYQEPTMFYYLRRPAGPLRLADPATRDRVGESFVLIARDSRRPGLAGVLSFDESTGRWVEGFNYARGRQERVWVGRASWISARDP